MEISRNNCGRMETTLSGRINMLLVPKKQNGLFVQYESFSGLMKFHFDGEEVYKKTVKECEEIFPHILWYKIKKDHRRFRL